MTSISQILWMRVPDECGSAPLRYGCHPYHKHLTPYGCTSGSTSGSASPLWMSAMDVKSYIFLWKTHLKKYSKKARYYRTFTICLLQQIDRACNLLSGFCSERDVRSTVGCFELVCVFVCFIIGNLQASKLKLRMEQLSVWRVIQQIFTDSQFWNSIRHTQTCRSLCYGCHP